MERDLSEHCDSKGDQGESPIVKYLTEVK